MKPKPLVSILVATKNEIEFIGQCLDSLLNQTYPQDSFQILVIDGESSDGTREFIVESSKKFQNIKYINNPKILSAAAWNLGLKQSQAEYFIIMGGHSIVPKDFVEKNVEILENNKSIPGCGGIVEARGLDKKSEIIALAFQNMFGVGNAKYWYGSQKQLVETIAFGAYNRKIINKVGFFDEKILRGQDWEFNYRIQKQFGNFVFSPEIRLTYYSRSSFTKLWKRQFKAGFWKIYILKRHPKSMLLRHIIPFFFSIFLFSLAVYSVLTFSFWPIVFFLGFYCLISSTISAKLSEHRLKDMIYLMWAFFIIHFAYGTGFLFGIPYFIFIKKIE